MKKILNEENIQGRVYSHSLELRTVKNEQSANFNKPYIAGTLEIAVDEEGLNVIPIKYSFITPTTKANKPNKTYSILERIITKEETWEKVGKDQALMVSATPALAVNDFISRKDNTLVSAKVNEGGFIDIISKLPEAGDAARHSFKCDMIITNVAHIEADEEKGIENDYVTVKGATFNFKNELVPVDFIVRNEQGMDTFESFGATNSNPVFLKVWGRIFCETIKVERTEESSFGEAAVKSYTKTSKNWVITGASPEPYAFDDESTITVAELKKAMQDRELHLAEVKKEAEDNSKNSFGEVAPKTVAAAATSGATFTF